ncbi:MAG: hypothetical protein O9341_18050 [Paucibacter sp.]|nr:hypothetical protein [Roseateles sp.]
MSSAVKPAGGVPQALLTYLGIPKNARRFVLTAEADKVPTIEVEYYARLDHAGADRLLTETTRFQLVEIPAGATPEEPATRHAK